LTAWPACTATPTGITTARTIPSIAAPTTVGALTSAATSVTIATPSTLSITAATRARRAASTRITRPLLIDAHENATTANRRACDLGHNSLSNVAGDLHDCVVFSNVDLPQLRARNSRFVRNRTDKVSGTRIVHRPHVDEQSGHRHTCGARSARFGWPSTRRIALLSCMLEESQRRCRDLDTIELIKQRLQRQQLS
jgi:hypothetical protein